MMTPHLLVAEAKAQITEVSPIRAAQLLQEGALCLDVREAGEHESECLNGAINIPRGVLEFRIGEHPLLSDRECRLLVYCKTGGRSALATLNLQRMGYRNVASIEGGIDAWRSQRLPLHKDTNSYGAK
jgi:rhodanese-related sulfurtransferase